MVSVITCRKCQHEREVTMPQLEDGVSCPVCGIHGHITMSNCVAVYLKSGRRLFVPSN